jgi:hypothetical protein
VALLLGLLTPEGRAPLTALIVGGYPRKLQKSWLRETGLATYFLRFPAGGTPTMAPKWAAKMPKLSIRSSGLSVPYHNKSQRIVANRNDRRVLCFVAVCFALFVHTCASAEEIRPLALIVKHWSCGHRSLPCCAAIKFRVALWHSAWFAITPCRLWGNSYVLSFSLVCGLPVEPSVGRGCAAIWPRGAALFLCVTYSGVPAIIDQCLLMSARELEGREASSAEAVNSRSGRSTPTRSA